MARNKRTRYPALVALLCLLGAAGWLAERLLAFTDVPEAQLELQRLRRQTQSSEEDIKALTEKRNQTLETFKKKNLIVPPPGKPSQPNLTGVFGDEAFLGGKWKKVGDSLGQGKVLEIGVDYVKITWMEEEKTLWLGPPAESGKSSGNESARPGRPTASRPSRPAPESDNQERVRPEQPDRERMGPPGRGRMSGRFGNLSPEEREAMRERFMNASPEEREEMRREFREGRRGRDD